MEAATDMPVPSAVVATAAANTLRQAKRTLRKEMAIKLNALDSASISSQSSQITSHVLQHRSFQDANKVSIYVSMEKGEVDTEDLCRQALSLGKRLYVPRFAIAAAAAAAAKPATSTMDGPSAVMAIAPAPAPAKFSTDMRMLRIHDWNDFEAMVMNKWGIREPEDDLQLETTLMEKREDALEETTGGDGLDLILAPGVAFDRQGGRLGHGKGYYDRYIERCDAFARKRNRSGPAVGESSEEENKEGEKVGTEECGR